MVQLLGIAGEYWLAITGRPGFCWSVAAVAENGTGAGGGLMSGADGSQSGKRG